MSLFTQKLAAKSEKINYKPSEGWHEVRIVALVDQGEEPNKFQDGKMQPKFSILFAVDEEIKFPSGDTSCKTHTEKFVASLHEKSNLVSKYLAPAGLTIESLDQLIGKNLKLKFKLTDDGKYLNVVNCDESEKPLAEVTDLYVPKYWIEDNDGVKTGFDVMVEAGVKNELMPQAKVEDTATDVDIAAVDAEIATGALDVEEDIYA